jgi:hypothetical protein
MSGWSAGNSVLSRRDHRDHQRLQLARGDAIRIDGQPGWWIVDSAFEEGTGGPIDIDLSNEDDRLWNTSTAKAPRSRGIGSRKSNGGTAVHERAEAAGRRARGPTEVRATRGIRR